MPKIKTKKQIKIQITKKAIREGKPSDGDFCPIALRIKPLPGFEQASVVGDEIEDVKIPFRMSLPPLSGAVNPNTGLFEATLPAEVENAIEDVNDVEIIDGEIRGTRMVNVRLPKKAQRFIESFDNGKKVKPFEFSITI